MTWHEVKLATLQKMMSANGYNIPSDEATVEYVAGMPQAANEALQLLFSANKYLRKSVEIEFGENAEGYDAFYDMSAAEDFYEVGNVEAYEIKDGKIRSCDGVVVRAGKYVTFPAAGTYLMYYNAWPKMFSKETEDNYTIPLENDVAVLLPLYMASQLYKDDDRSIATAYRNEFEAARMELRNRTGGTYRDVFVNKSGW